MPRHATDTGLTAKEEMFIAAYVAGDPREFGNATRAALTAGYSERTAARIGSELLQKPKIKAAVQAELRRLSAKLNLTAEKVLKDIERISNKAEVAGKFGDALAGKKLLGQHLKLFTEKHEHGGIGGGPVLFQITPDEADH